MMICKDGGGKENTFVDKIVMHDAASLASNLVGAIWESIQEEHGSSVLYADISL